jgi:hypothetical protein
MPGRYIWEVDERDRDGGWSLPEDIKVLEKDLPTRRLCFDSACYQAEKIKRIAVGKRSRGGEDLVALSC